MINKNPMENVEMIKKANFLSAQGKENLPECETVTILNSDELKRFKEEVYATYSNGVKQADGSVKALNPKQVADLLGHTTSQITEMYYVKKDTSRLNGVTDGFEI